MKDATEQSNATTDLARSAADRRVEPLRKGMRLAGILLLAVLIGLPAVQVFLRSVVGAPFVGAEELARFMLICVVYITLPYVTSSGTSIRMEEILSMLPQRAQRWLRILIAATGVIVFSIASYSVALATLRNLHNATPTLGIPYWIFFSAVFLGLLGAALESCVQFVKALRARPLYVTFAEEHASEQPDLEQALAVSPPRGVA